MFKFLNRVSVAKLFLGQSIGIYENNTFQIFILALKLYEPQSWAVCGHQSKRGTLTNQTYAAQEAQESPCQTPTF